MHAAWPGSLSPGYFRISQPILRQIPRKEERRKRMDREENIIEIVGNSKRRRRRRREIPKLPASPSKLHLMQG